MKPYDQSTLSSRSWEGRRGFRGPTVDYGGCGRRVTGNHIVFTGRRVKKRHIPRWCDPKSRLVRTGIGVPKC